MGLIWLRDERAFTNTTAVIYGLTRRVQHCDVRTLRSKSLNHVPSAGRPDQIDISKDDIDPNFRVAHCDGLFAACSLEDAIAGGAQNVGYVKSDESFVLDHENDHRTIAICAWHRHVCSPSAPS